MPTRSNQAAPLGLRSGSRGFTLIEASVAMALLAVLVGFVAPSMARWYAGVGLRVSMSDVQNQTAALQSHAVMWAKDVALKDALAAPASATQAGRVVLPAGWRVEGTEGAMFWRNGLCTPGKARLRTEDLAITLTLRNSTCALSVEFAPAGVPAS